MDDLEEATPKVEEVEPTPKEVAEPTPKEAEPTVGITETEEFRHALDKAVGKSTATLQQQVTISKQATQAAEAHHETLKATLAKSNEDIRFLEQKLEGLADERFADDPEAVRGFKNTIALELRERKAVAKDEALNLKEAEQEGFRQAYLLGEKSLELKKKRQIPSGILESCTSVEQMDTIAQAFPEVGEPKEEAKKEEKPKFDSGISSGTGGNWRELSSDEKLKRGYSQK